MEFEEMNVYRKRGYVILLFLLFFSRGVLLCWPTEYPSREERYSDLIDTERLSSPVEQLKSTPQIQPNILHRVSHQAQEDAPILINGNAEFLAIAALEGWQGNGTASNPYRLEGLNITGHTPSPLIEIYSTELYFVISDCYLRGGSYGIILENISSGRAKIEKNTIINQTETGISITQVENCTISRNYISTDVFWHSYGVKVTNSQKIAFSNNTLRNNSVPMAIFDSSNCTFVENFVSYNNYSVGFYDSERTVVVNNTFTNHTDMGPPYGATALSFWNSPYSVISGNTITDNLIGICAWGDSINTRVSKNFIVNNSVGIWILDAQNLTIVENHFENNNRGLYLKTHDDFIATRSVVLNKNVFLNDGLSLDTHHAWIFLPTVINHNNTINGKPLVIWQNVHGGIIPSGVGQIILSNCTGVTVTNQNLTYTTIGIMVFTCKSIDIHGNVISANSISGISIFYSENCTLTTNFISDSYTGITINGDSNFLTNNTVSNNTVGIFLVADVIQNQVDNNYLVNNFLYCPFYHNEIANNYVNGKPLVFWRGISNRAVPSDAGQIFLVNCSTIEVTDQTIGMKGMDCQNLNIDHNNINSGCDEIFLWSSVNCSVTSNTLLSMRYGIYILDSNFCTVSGNTVTATFGCGIMLGNSDFAYISNNNVTKNTGAGIYLDDSKNNRISGNLISENKQEGISMRGDSRRNVLVANIIKNNTGGGFFLDYRTESNLIRYNDFLQNNINASQADDDGSENLFIHNYWDDWLGPDSDDDGVIDSPYLIGGSANNSDSQPLAFPAPSHQLSMPILLFPNGGETLRGNVTVYWFASADSWDDQINYSVYFSFNGGTTWNALKIAFSSTNYSWDTTHVDDGEAYLIKVIASCSDGLTTEYISDSQFTIHNVLLPPILLSPSGGRKYIGLIDLRWSASVDPLRHNITYSLYYSVDNKTWEPIVTGLSSTRYTWIVFPRKDGSSYLIKVIARCSGGLTAEDISDQVFSIRNSELYFFIGRVILFGISILSTLYFGNRLRQKRIAGE